MEQLKMHAIDYAKENVQKVAQLFPNCVTETANGLAIDFEKLQQELSEEVMSGSEERYQFTWPGKRAAIREANSPCYLTLRPSREDSVDFDKTKNLYIEGDNLQVLKLLRESYLGKVKMIYIDPPYNTGNDFVYNDDFSQSAADYKSQSDMFDEDGNMLLQNYEVNSEASGRYHSEWLNMMYPRLKVAKDLLTEDGVIFISIDDNELENLKKVCDEIFGNTNFIAHMVHKNNSMKNQSKYIGVSTEYVLIYCKNYEGLKKSEKEWRIKKKGTEDIKKTFLKLKSSGLSIPEIQDEILNLYARPKYAHLGRWNKVDEEGVFTDKDLSRANGPKNYTIVNPLTGKPCLIPNRGWGKSLQELEDLQSKGLIWYGDDKTPPREKSYLSDEADSVCDNFIYVDTSIDKRILDELLGENVFEFPKPLEMLNTFLQLASNTDSIILDFFSGSATTAHAVMQLNAEDKGNRKFVMVQLPEAIIDSKSEAYKAGYKNICEIGKERIRRAGKKIKADAGEAAKDLDTGFRVLKLASSNMNDVYYTPQDTNLNDLFAENIKSDRTPEDLLFQVLPELNLPLSAKIETKTIAGKQVFVVEDNYLAACFDEDITDECITAIAKTQPYHFVMRESGAHTDQVLDNFDQLFKAYSPKTTTHVM